METLGFPSPSNILTSPVLPPAPLVTAPRLDAKQKQPAKAKAKAKAQTQPAKPKVDGVTKPKQSKSRNGCVTCKQKRLKCDETKPACLQCHKRGVECGGYKKDFKWRPFEEASFAASKPAGQPRSKRSTFDADYGSGLPDLCKDSQDLKQNPPQQSPASSDDSGSTTSPTAGQESPHAFMSSSTGSPIVESYRASRPRREGHLLVENPSSFPYENAVPLVFAQPAERPFPQSASLIFDHQESSHACRGRSWSTNLTAPLARSRDSLPRQHHPLEADLLPEGRSCGNECIEDIEQDEVEELVQGNGSQAQSQLIRARSSTFPALNFLQHRANVSSYIPDEPKLKPHSLELLGMRFNESTCAILSVKNGARENPWRTVMLPMAKGSPALVHAIACMSAFHASRTEPHLSRWGLWHKQQSIAHLRKIDLDSRPIEALATSLALAFADSWDKEIASGPEYLAGGRACVEQALMMLKQKKFDPAAEMDRVRFLCNTWLYMDAIARLTCPSLKDEREIDVELWSQIHPSGEKREIDPLMGCATTLFPIIQRVAKLVRRVCKMRDNSVQIVSQARELKQELEQWEAPSELHKPEDPNCEIEHSLQTAEAYRWATLLYLHQAVPENPSRSSYQLAQIVLKEFLATVPLNSKTVIVQIYPLLAAGCEMQSKDDRKWVRDRWISMLQKMQIGNIDRCLEVVTEVWRRRDEAERAQWWQMRNGADSSVTQIPRPRFSRYFLEPWDQWPVEMSQFPLVSDDWLDASRMDIQYPSPLGSMSRPRRDSEEIVERIEFDLTVRGRLHWVGVMRENGWEVLLG